MTLYYKPETMSVVHRLVVNYERFSKCCSKVIYNAATTQIRASKLSKKAQDQYKGKINSKYIFDRMMKVDEDSEETEEGEEERSSCK